MKLCKKQKAKSYIWFKSYRSVRDADSVISQQHIFKKYCNFLKMVEHLNKKKTLHKHQLNFVYFLNKLVFGQKINVERWMLPVVNLYVDATKPG